MGAEGASRVATRSWPSPGELHYCSEVWRCSPPALRWELTGLQDETLACSLAERACKLGTLLGGYARRRCGLEEIELTGRSPLRPAAAHLGARLCAAAGGFETLLSMAARDEPIWLASGLAEDVVGTDASWEAFACRLFTHILASLLTRCRRKWALDLASLQRVLLGPFATPAGRRREWPSREAAARLRRDWATRLSPVERVRVTKLIGGPAWLAQACEVVVRCWAGNQRVRPAAEDPVMLDDALFAHHMDSIVYERGARAADLLSVSLQETFVATPGCLECIMCAAVGCRAEAQHLFALAGAATPALLQVTPVLFQGQVGATWGDLARVVFTLMLAQAMEACKVLRGNVMRRPRRAEEDTEKKETPRHRENACRRCNKQGGLARPPDMQTRGGTVRVGAAAVTPPLPSVPWFLQRTFVTVIDDPDGGGGPLPRRSRSAP